MLNFIVFGQKLEHRRRNKPLSRSLRETSNIKPTPTTNQKPGKRHTRPTSFIVPGASSVRLSDSLAYCFQKALHYGQSGKFSQPITTVPLIRPNTSDAILVEQHQLRGGLTRSRKGSTASADAALIRGTGNNPISNFIGRLSRRVPTSMKNGPEIASTSNGKTDFEFRPTPSNAGNNSPASARSTGGSSTANGSQTRSKSPSAIINRFTNFARGKYRNSLSEKTSNTVTTDDRLRRVRNF